MNVKWEQHKLDALAKFSKGKGYSKKDVTFQGYPLFLYGRLYTNYSEVVSDVDTYTSNLLEGSAVSNADEVVLPDSGETAEDIARASWINKKGIILGGGLLIIHPDKYLINSGFLSYSLSYGSNHKKLSSYAQGKSIVHIHSNDLKKLYIFYPSRFNEQSKIFNILNYLENLITLQQRKMEQLKQLKKAMLQQLFVNKNNKQPILKFKNFRNNWREYKLSEIVNLEDNKRKPVKATERIRGKIPYYGANGIQDYVKGYTHIGKHVLIAEDGANSVDDYPIYFIYSPSWINNHTHVLTAKEEILSSEFLAYALKKINYAKYLVGSGRYKLNAEILKLIPLKIPTMNEQKYIESNLSKIDKLIALQQNKLTQLTALKKYLLQKLFI
ncbi:restriction endonuclease subunit S [Limosilactobacillus reuteri]|uniref:restriction endonuclease subunit S n=1 Tax=Limosilactobacillus reuteri TaxID=1598 RepID=UPI001E3EF837|nr:restriction endonuclease subunit S [Limosilactobacillus reuteri]MCC4331719.1 restriction endonuclease subunit S [Limosilactobacillus reuteri]